MSLSEKLIKSAVLGTNKHPITVDQADTPEAQLLLDVANQKLRDRLGYVPMKEHLLLSQPEKFEEQYVSQKAMDYLRLILSGVHHYALHEWLITATQHGLVVREDILPTLLRIGNNVYYLRHFILPVLGYKGMKLAADITNQNWNWALESVQYMLEENIDYERLREEDMIKQLRSAPLHNLREHYNEWRKYRMQWSAELVNAFINSFSEIKPRQSTMYSWWSASLSRDLMPYAYFMPVDMWDHIDSQLMDSEIISSGGATDILATFRIIWKFRRDMLATLTINQE